METVDENLYIGFGINAITASGPNVENLTGRLFDRSFYADPNGIDTITINGTNVAAETSERFVEVFSSTEISAKVETGKAVAAFFTGSLETRFGSSKKMSSSSKFFNAVASVETKKHVITSEYSSALDMRDILLPKNRSRIDDLTIDPDDLFKAYGTHIITTSSIGGMIQVHGVYTSSENISTSDFHATLSMACRFASASSSVTKTDKEKKILSSTTIHAKSYGGDVSVIVGALTLDDIKTSFKKWGKSILDQKSQSLARTYSYMPIWELAGSKQRKEQLFKAFLSQTRGQYQRAGTYFGGYPLPSKPENVILINEHNSPTGTIRHFAQLVCSSYGAFLFAGSEVISDRFSVF